MTTIARIIAVACAVAFGAPSAGAQAPVGWLGDGTAHYPAGDASGKWSTKRGVRWSVALPDWGNSSPVVHGDRVFVTAEPATLMALSLSKGRVLWRHDASYADTVSPSERRGFKARLAKAKKLSKQLEKAELTLNRLQRDMRKAGAKANAQASFDAASAKVAKLVTELEAYAELRPPEVIPDMGSASATPVTDGEAVYAVFGNGVVLARGIDGTPRWARFLGKPKLAMRGYHRGQAASPVLVDGVLVVAMNQLVGLDPKTGETRWTGEDYIEFGAPTPVTLADGKRYLVTPGGDVIRARDGRRVAKDIGLVYFVSPAAQGDRIYFVGADENPASLSRTATAAQLTVQGDTVTATRLWRTTLSSERTFACPVIHEGILYALGQGSTLSALRLSDGAILYEEKLDLGNEAAYATPVLTAGALVAAGLGGQAAVVRLGETFELLGTHSVEGGRATPAFAGKDLIHRGLEKLWRIQSGAR